MLLGPAVAARILAAVVRKPAVRKLAVHTSAAAAHRQADQAVVAHRQAVLALAVRAVHTLAGAVRAG